MKPHNLQTVFYVGSFDFIFIFNAINMYDFARNVWSFYEKSYLSFFSSSPQLGLCDGA